MPDLDKFFAVTESGSTLKREFTAGLTTFLAMAYIVFVNPSILSTDFTGKPTGLDFGAVVLATCLAASVSSVIMGFYGKYPIALAPGMGENFFTVTVIMSLASMGYAEPWRTALGIIFVSGILFFLISVSGLRKLLMDGISPSLRTGITAGIGLFIAFIGLRNGGLIVDRPGTLVGLTPSIFSGDAPIFFVGLLVSAAFMARKTPGALLLGITAAALAAYFSGKLAISGIFGLPHVEHHIAFQMDIVSALTANAAPFIVVYLFMNFFDATGTLVGIAEAGGFIKDGKLPRAREALLSDAAGTMTGAMLGTSTVTSFIESAAGVSAGGRTGLTAVIAGLFFLAALPFGPLISSIGGVPPVTSAALVIVGAMMMSLAGNIDWSDYTESIPSFVIIAGIPLTYSIADGLALGFILYPALKMASGRAREAHWIMYPLGLLLIGYFLFIRPAI